MLGKNNFDERLRKMDEKRDRFSIRKLTIGAASVLIGSVVFGLSAGSQVKADAKPDIGLAVKSNSESRAAADSRLKAVSSESAASKATAAGKVKIANKSANDSKIVAPSSEGKSELSKKTSGSEQKQDEAKSTTDKSQTQSNQKSSSKNEETKINDAAKQTADADKPIAKDAKKTEAGPVIKKAEIGNERVKIIFNDHDTNAADDSDAVKTALSNGTTVTGDSGAKVDFSKVTLPIGFEFDGIPSYTFNDESKQQITINVKHKKQILNTNDDETGLTDAQKHELVVDREYKIVRKFPDAKYGKETITTDRALHFWRTGTWDEATNKFISFSHWTLDDRNMLTGETEKGEIRWSTATDSYTQRNVDISLDDLDPNFAFDGALHNWLINNYDLKNPIQSMTTTDPYKLYDGFAYLGMDLDPNADNDLINLDASRTFTFIYTPKQVTRHIQYIDDDEGGKQIGNMQDVTGDVDTSKTFNITVPTNYVLAPNQTGSISVDLSNVKGSDGTWAVPTANIVIHLKHATRKIDENNIPSGAKNSDNSSVTKKDFEEKLKRTITITKPDGSTDTSLSQTITITQSGTYDEVTGMVKYNGDWSTGSFGSVTVPVIDGYTPSQKNVASVSVTHGYVDPKIVISYKANDSSFNIVYRDDTGKEIGRKTLNGKTGEAVDQNSLTDNIPAGWVIDGTAPTLPAKFAPQGQTAEVDVKIKHGSKEIKPGDNIPKGNDPSEGQPKNDIKPSDSEHTLKRIITINKPDGTSVTETQTIAFQRTGHIDTVTGEVTWNAWKPVDPSKDSFAEYDAPTIDGYTPNKKAYAENKVNYSDGQADETVTIGYTANDSSFNIIYKDNTGKEIGRKTLNGKTGDSLDQNSITSNLPAGWVIDGTAPTLPGKFAPQDQEKDVTVIVKHGSKTINPGDVIPAGADPTKGQPKNDIKPSDSEHTLKRIIIINKPDGTLATETQTIDFQRTGHIDTVTGEVTWDAWQPVDPSKDSFAEYDAPKIDGYTPNKKADAEDDVSYTDGQTDETVTIGYTANDSSFNIVYKDDTGKEIGRKTLSGKTGEAVDQNSLTDNIPAGWVIDGTVPTLPAKFAPQDQTAEVDVKIKHGSKKIKPGDSIPHGTDPSKGQPKNDVKPTDSQHTLKRIIIVNKPDGTKITETQTINFQRTGHIDTVTGEVTWDAWQPVDPSKDSFAEYDAPTIDGYTPNKKAEREDDVSYTTGQTDETVIISYTKNVKPVNPSRPDNPVAPSDDNNGNHGHNNPSKDKDQEYNLIFVDHNHRIIERIPNAFKGHPGQVLTRIQLKPILKKYMPKGWILSKYVLVKGVTLRNGDVVIQVVPATYRLQVLYIGRQGRIVKQTYITVSRTHKAGMKYLADLSKTKRPKGFHQTYKLKRVGNHLNVWVFKKRQLPRKRLTKRKLLTYFVLPSGKIVKETYLRQPVSKQKLYRQLHQRYHFTGQDRVNNHLDIWLKNK